MWAEHWSRLSHESCGLPRHRKPLNISKPWETQYSYLQEEECFCGETDLSKHKNWKTSGSFRSFFKYGSFPEITVLYTCYKKQKKQNGRGLSCPSYIHMHQDKDPALNAPQTGSKSKREGHELFSIHVGLIMPNWRWQLSARWSVGWRDHCALYWWLLLV